jgi:hypothetical protein
MGKRQRANPSWWKPVVEWICSAEGGIVHKSIVISSDRELYVEEDIAEGAVLFHIPLDRLVSPDTAIGALPFITANSSNNIALYLASLKSQARLPYLETLPDRSTFDALPRRWSENQLDQLLSGSPLLDRVMKSRASVREDYESAKQTWGKLQKDDTRACPNFDDFCDMLAAVTSRAFGVGDQDDDIAMVPLLDLCNHCRGKNAEKNLSYKRMENGSIQVKSTKLIPKESLLAITYGAKGNAPLLLNYGFTIPQNLEPDGSSNDILEFGKGNGHDNNVVLELQTGFKSYSYGCFVKALEHYYDTKDKAIGMDYGGPDDDQEEDDMEAFLNECDEEKDEEGFFDGEDDDEQDGDKEEEDEEQVLQSELKALDSFRNGLQQARAAYKLQGSELTNAASLGEPSPRYYAAILIQSEHRTIQFFLRAIEKVEILLKAKYSKPSESTTNGTTSSGLDGLSKDDCELIERQTAELAETFMTIRHSDFL